ncbi:hypothetical protein SESI111939_01505 [Serratia silvae]
MSIPFKNLTRGEIAHLVIDSTGLKVFGEGEWKVKKHGQEKRGVWRKLHLAVDADTHEVSGWENYLDCGCPKNSAAILLPLTC